MKQLSDKLAIIGMILGVVGIFLFICGASIGWIGVLASGLLLFFTRLSNRMKEKELHRQRILAISMFSAIALCVAAYFMMQEKQYWLLPLMITATLEFYVSFRLK